MKKFIFLLLVFSFVSTSCSEKNNSIIGTWKFHNTTRVIDITGDVDNIIKLVIDQKDIPLYSLNHTYTFGEDATYTLRTFDQKVETNSYMDTYSDAYKIKENKLYWNNTDLANNFQVKDDVLTFTDDQTSEFSIEKLKELISAEDQAKIDWSVVKISKIIEYKNFNRLENPINN